MEDKDPSCNPMQTERTKKDSGDLSHEIMEGQDKNAMNATSREPASETDYSNFDIVRATQYGVTERCKELIEAGFDVNQLDREDVSLLHWAAINNRTDLIKFYISKGAILDRFGGNLNSTPLHWATRQGHLTTVVQLMSYGADPSLRDGEGCSCIHLGAQFGHTSIVAYLIAKGQDVNMVDKNGMTPLMWSAYRVFGCDPTRLLMTFGATVNTGDRLTGNYPLHWACLTGNNIVIKMLLEHGANMDVNNNKGQSPIDIALETKTRFLSSGCENSV
ncbi:hypothetical protein ScPMuIL_016203 [Solemya velum]